MDRINVNGYNTGMSGLWSNEGRKISREQFVEVYDKLIRIDDGENKLYGEEWVS